VAPGQAPDPASRHPAHVPGSFGGQRIRDRDRSASALGQVIRRAQAADPAREEPMYEATYVPGTGRRQPLRPVVGQRLPCSSEPELFFADSADDVQRAKALCRACPVQSACLAEALQRGEPYGVWGGALFVRGVVTAGKKPRGRPRKSAPAEGSAHLDQEAGGPGAGRLHA
jgi:WhiB family transcriptional regulator, redox-sensing transcriptional regulator